MTPANFVLVPGFWLGAWAWDATATTLIDCGHTVTAITLPGLESVDVDRAPITFADHLYAVIGALEGGPVEGSVLVGHSGAGPLVYQVADRRPDLVRHLVYVDSGPIPPGRALGEDIPTGVVELPLPSWDELEADGSSVDGLDDRMKAIFAARAVPEPAGPLREPVTVTDEARYRIPTTVVTSTLTPDQVRDFVAEGHPYFAELAQSHPRIIGLTTGHWPMFSRPDDLARILAAVDGLGIDG